MSDSWQSEIKEICGGFSLLDMMTWVRAEKRWGCEIFAPFKVSHWRVEIRFGDDPRDRVFLIRDDAEEAFGAAILEALKQTRMAVS